MNAAEIKEQLNGRVQEVCEMLLPAGKKDGVHWIAGDVKGNPGTSLKVHLEGQYQGYFKDFASAEDKGSILDLWVKARGVSFREALEQAAQFLGVELTNENKAFYRKTPAPAGGARVDFVPVREGGAVWNYLVEKRKLTPEILQRFGVSETHDGKAMVFPYRSEDGKRVEMAKYIALDRDEEGKKKVWTSKDTTPTLFGKETIIKDQGCVVICEGEIDAMTIAQQSKVSAVSVPYGAKGDTKDGRNPNDPWIAKDFEFLEQFQNIYLCFDADDPGRKAAAGLVKRLGVERCLLIRLPEDAKDPNALLVGGRMGELGSALGNARSLDPEHLKLAEDYRDATLEEFFPKDEKEPGFPLMWNIPFRVRAGEVTLWTGFSGHGKTMLLSELMVHLMTMGEKACIASMEIPASMTLQNLWIQASARHKPQHEAEFDRFYRWFTNRVWIYDRMGDVNPQEVLSVFRYAAKRYGVTQFVVDSLDKLNIGRDDYDRHRAVMNDLNAFANDMRCHVHFVCHSRKPEHNDESNIPGKYEVSGSAVLTNLCWNGITVWRNKAKEAALDPEHPDYEDEIGERAIVAGQHDAFFRVWKQRKTGTEPVKKLWYDRDSKQYRDKSDKLSKVYAEMPVQ